MKLLETKWLALIGGSAILGLALALPETILPRNYSQPVFLLGMLFLFDGMMAVKVMDYATTRGPEERRERLERLYYEILRARRRYFLAFGLFAVALTAVSLKPLGDWYLFLMIGVITAYGVVAMVQLFRCRSIAGQGLKF